MNFIVNIISDLVRAYYRKSYYQFLLILEFISFDCSPEIVEK